MMEEIAVDLMSIQKLAQNAYALNEKGKARMQQHHLEDGNKKDQKPKYCMHTTILAL